MFNPNRTYTFSHRFTEINLLPTYTGRDGREYRYGDALVSGEAEITYDMDGDWSVTEIRLETSEKAEGRFSPRAIYVFRKIDRNEPWYAVVKAAIERECKDAIREEMDNWANEDFDADDMISMRRELARLDRGL